MHGAFVTGTGTGVGKSIVAAALCAALRARGDTLLASKPLLSGLDDAPNAPWPHDHELLALAAGGTPDEIAPASFGPAVSPHLAARLVGQHLAVDAIVAGIQARAAATASAQASGSEPTVVVEGAGGLLVPVNDDGATMADLATALELPLIVAAHPGLGTINHVLLTLEAARSRGLRVAGVVLTPWPAQPSLIESDNRAFLTQAAGTPVVGLPAVAAPDRELLAAAGQHAGLPALLES
ncbi:MAG: dethiobiotin synthase [Solirubrobacteraceae bacterium]|nr:dethiobiotin synthase [Solirubrobacteraceae bacterium]